MSLEIKKVYTENPYVDELVYYSKILGNDTILKMQQVADNAETLESLRNGNMLISCVEGTAPFELFDSVSDTALRSVGIVDPLTMISCMNDINQVPEEYRNRLLPILRQEFIEKYEEQNSYYRMLHGLPPIGHEDYITDWIPPDDTIIDLSKPVHKMTEAEIHILDNAGVLEKMITMDPDNCLYMRHMGKKSIDYYLARRANRFDPLYIPTIDSDSIQKMYEEKLNSNKFYVLRTVYSDAFKYNSDYYDNFIAVFIILITIIDVISRVQEFIARKEIFDIRSVQYIFKSYGVPFFEQIPLKYQISMVKNLHTLLKYKSTSKCMVDICSLFGFKNIEIFKYYLLKDRKLNIDTGEFVFSEDGDPTEEYELKFLKIPLEDELETGISSGSGYIDYDEITYGDPVWDGGLNHEDIINRILKEEFNFVRTKYLSIDTIYEIAKMSEQQSYFFNFLYDNVPFEEHITVKVPYIDGSRNFKVADIFTLLTVLTYYYNGVKDIIHDTQSKILYVNGFNFKADLAELATLVSNKKTGNSYVDSGTPEHAKQQLEKFIIPNEQIPSFGEMMNIYVNNMEVRQELLLGMRNADNKRIYDIYKKLYDALMTVELTFDHYKNPETGDLYRDEDGDATFTEFLKHKDSTLYYAIIQIEDFEDDESKKQYIASLIDSIVYALEEYIDSSEFQAIFSNLPVMSSEAVKQYIITVISFYMSYKVDFLGMNTVYTLDDKTSEYIQIIDDITRSKFFDKDEYVRILDYACKTLITLDKKERVKFVEKIYMDISTWINKEYRETIGISESIPEILIMTILKMTISIAESITHIDLDFDYIENIRIREELGLSVSSTLADKIDVHDVAWLYNESQI